MADEKQVSQTQPQVDPVALAEQNLRSLLFKGRILINGAPLTGEEINHLFQDLQVLHRGAASFQQAQAMAAAKAAEKKVPGNKNPKTPKKG